MGDLTNVEKELAKERKKLDRMINDARMSHRPSDDGILEQSRKVDALLAQVQKARLSKHEKSGKPRENQKDR
jgi:hypothetical protein